jgi:class 3 adenylate cyclase
MALARVLCPALVGRESELSVLEDALLSALRGDGGVVIVGGEAGMGKTRLVNELVSRAHRLHCAVMTGACSEAELSLPHLPFLEAIGNRLSTEDLDEVRKRLGPAADELAQLFPQLGRAPAPGSDPMQAKLRLFEAILLLLRDAARDRALLLVLEDLQWADPATRELLDYMTRRLRSTNVLVVATYRVDEMHRKHPLVPTIQGWRRSGQADFVELKPMAADAIGEMVCTIFDESEITAEFRDFLRDRSEGNPFVLEEMLREALDRGDIFHTATGWDRKAISDIRLPQTVRAAIIQRLTRLQPQDVIVLSAAAVVGRAADLAMLGDITRLDEATVLSSLETCVTFQLLEEDDRATGRYRFRHALTREAVYEDMVVPRRQQLHGRVAEVLKSRPDAAPVDLAHHLLMAGRYDDAVVMCVAAAEDAIHALAYHDAGELLERAAPHVPNAVERGRLLCRAGDAYWNNNESDSGRRLLEEGIANLEAAGLAIEAAGWRLVLGRCYWELLRSDIAREHFERARDVLEEAGPSEALAIAYLRISGLISFDRVTETSLEYARRAAETAKQADAPMAYAWSLNFMAIAEVHLGQVEQGFAHLEESYRASIEGGHQFQAINAVFNGAWTAVHLGLGRRAQLWSERAGEWERTTQVWTPYIRGLVRLSQGHIPDSIELARQSIQMARYVGHEKQRWRSSVLVAHALAENMQGDEAAELMPPVSSRIDGQDVIYDTAARISVLLAQGDTEGAFECARTTPTDVRDLGSIADAISMVARKDPAWLRTYLEALNIVGELKDSPRFNATRGRLALYEDRLDEALGLLQLAAAAFEDGGLWLDAWLAGRSLAEAEARSGDATAARARLEAIASDAEAAGARLAARLARETAASLGFDLAPAIEADGGAPATRRITPGERLVSVLFADVRGYTEMSRQAAPAEIGDGIATLQRWAAQEVGRRHGIVDKFAGDAIMATFNVSGQSVDHALQALRAALAIIDKAALAGLPVGAGLAVGPAVVGTLSDAANVSVLGEATNLAARLQAQAGPGEVVLSEEAHRRVKDWLDGRRLSAERVELELKGFNRPVSAFRLTTSAISEAPKAGTKQRPF